MLVSVFMGDNGCHFRILPLIAVRVIEVPVRVDHVLDRIATETTGLFQDARAGYGDPGIDEHLAVGACQDTNISTRTLQDTDVTAEPVNFDGRFRGLVTDHIHDVARLRESLSRREPSSTCRGRSRRHAAQTESAPRHDVLRKRSHGFSPAANRGGAAALTRCLCDLNRAHSWTPTIP